MLLSALGCGGSSPAEYMQAEARFLRVGVDRTVELSQVKRVLAQRGLAVVSERTSFGCIAVGAASSDGAKSAIRIISSRGVVFAADAAFDDLFSPSRVALVDTLPDSLEDMELFAFTRTAKGYDLGCVTVGRVLRDGTAVPLNLDVSRLGERACVSEIRHAGSGKLLATVSWPLLSVPGAPATLDVLLALDRPRLNEAAPMVRTARIEASPELLHRETQRLSSLPSQPTFEERQAIAVGRAALAHLRGDDRDKQLGVYREALGSVRSGTYESRLAADTAGHILRGWLELKEEGAEEAEPREGAERAPSPAEEDAIVIEPEGPPVPAAEHDMLAPPTEGH